MKNLTLTEIRIYPIKAMGGISMSKSNFLNKGLENDRRWMLIDENFECMTQRTFPIMATFKLIITEENIEISFNNDHLTIPICVSGGTGVIRAKIFDDIINVIEPNPTFSKWFGDKLGCTCKLVFFPEENARPIDPLYNKKNSDVSLADGFPFLIIGESSLEYLNNRMASSLPMNRFRPNFVFGGGDAFDEDNWNEFTIGSHRFIAIKPCARCIVPAVDQETGIRGKEPIKTLANLRSINNKTYFGQNMIPLESNGMVRVGDAIEVLNHKKELFKN